MTVYTKVDIDVLAILVSDGAVVLLCWANKLPVVLLHKERKMRKVGVVTKVVVAIRRLHILSIMDHILNIIENFFLLPYLKTFLNFI